MNQKLFVQTARRQMAYYRLGDQRLPKLLLIHGNASSSAFFFPTIMALAKHFDVAAPDLNGFGDTQASPVHSPTALGDWAEDISAFADAIGFERLALLGWSLGGGVAWRYAILHPGRLSHLILLSPMSPYGFGGTRGVAGEMYDQRGWGSPGGFANKAFIERLQAKDRSDAPMAARKVLEKSLFADGYTVSSQWQDLFVDELLKIRLGEDYYPGDYLPLAAFPYVLPGQRGISNALAPQYANMAAFLDIQPQPPVLWIRGERDTLVSDKSLSDLATLGQLGYLPGYPGEEAFPSQPMVAQTRAFLETYQERGGRYRELMMPGCAHASHLEKPEAFVAALCDFAGGRSGVGA
ncbi:MAG: alpha/beta fold hydrolase [Christensenellales bacterium]